MGMRRMKNLAKKIRTRRLPLWLMGLALCWWAPTALGQAEARVTEQEQSKPIMAWGAVVVFTGLIIAIAVKNPKRTHLS